MPRPYASHRCIYVETGFYMAEFMQHPLNKIWYYNNKNDIMSDIDNEYSVLLFHYPSNNVILRVLLIVHSKASGRIA